MSEQLEAARRELREALTVAQASLVQVRGGWATSPGASTPGGPHRDQEADDDDDA